MGMIMGMGHWLLWAVLALVAIFALINLVTWMREEKKRGIANTQNRAQTLAQVTNEPIPNSSNTPPDRQPIYHDATKHKGWGFWPWALLSLLVLGGLAGLIWKSSMAPGAPAFQWILWALLPMAGLISLLGISQMNRRHPLVDEKKGRPRGLGFLTLLTGLVLGLASWFIWLPQTAGLTSLQNNISDLTAKNNGLMSKLSSRNTIIERLRGDADKDALRYADLEKDRDATNSTYTNEITRLKGLIGGLEGQLSASQSEGDQISRLTARVKSLGTEKDDLGTENKRMNALIGTYKNDSEVQSAKIEALNAEIETLRNKPVAPATRAIVTKRHDTPLAMMHKYNQDETKLRLTSSDYNMVKRANNELVNGKRGRYYTIALRNPANGNAYKFASASYSKIENDTAFKQSLDRVISDIRGAFDGKRSYQIYVQGKASASRYSGKMAKDYNYSHLKALKNLGGSYGPDMIEKTYGTDITNKDLPNLRGAYLQEYLARYYKINKPVILEGSVSKSKKTFKQAVAIILFVED